MNTSPTSPTTPDLESLRKAIREYQPDPSRIPFSNLKPFHDSIVELRGKNASYAAIAELLEQPKQQSSQRGWHHARHHPKQHGWQQGVNGRLASGEAFRAALGEILASRKNLVKIRGNACLN